MTTEPPQGGGGEGYPNLTGLFGDAVHGAPAYRVAGLRPHHDRSLVFHPGESMTITAKYEDGVFRPLEDVSISEGTIVEVRVPPYATASSAKPARLGILRSTACGRTGPTSATASNTLPIFSVTFGSERSPNTLTCPT